MSLLHCKTKWPAIAQTQLRSVLLLGFGLLLGLALCATGARALVSAQSQANPHQDRLSLDAQAWQAYELPETLRTYYQNQAYLHYCRSYATSPTSVPVYQQLSLDDKKALVISSQAAMLMSLRASQAISYQQWCLNEKPQAL